MPAAEFEPLSHQASGRILTPYNAQPPGSAYND